MIKRIIEIVKKHKIISIIAACIVVGGSFYEIRALKAGAPETKYVLTQVQKGTLSTTISGSGQVSALQQVDVKARASGDITKVNVQVGDEVKAGKILAQINASDVYKSVRDARANLDSANLSLEKIKKPVDDLSITQAENKLAQAQESKEKLENDLNKTYDDGFTAVANAFLDLPDIMDGLDGILHDETFQSGQANIDWYYDQMVNSNNQINTASVYRQNLTNQYTNAIAKFNATLDVYKQSSRVSSPETIESLITETYDTVKLISDTIKSTNNFIDLTESVMNDFHVNIPGGLKTYQTSIDSYISQTNSHISSLLNIKNSIQSSKISLADAERSITESTLSLNNVKEGVDPLDIKSAELTVKQRQNALYDAQEKLADYSVKAPFDGTVAAIEVKKGDSVSSGGTMATIITNQRIAKITLNEVDVAKVQEGQKVNLTFDAVEGLEITGQVAEVDTLGTVSQGVVSYEVTIVFDTQDERIKPGMSVTATIITDIKQDVLMIPVSALKTQGNTTYVEIVDKSQVPAGTSSAAGVTLSNAPKSQIVETGISNDTSVEIISGLSEGETIVSRTITQATTASTQTQSAPSLFGAGGGTNRAFGGGTSGVRTTR